MPTTATAVCGVQETGCRLKVVKVVLVVVNKKSYSVKIRVNPRQKLKNPSMKKQKFIELAVKVVVAALTAFLTALGTTSCM